MKQSPKCQISIW